MSRPYNDQWVLRRAGAQWQRRQAQPLGTTGPAPAPARALADALRVVGHLGKRPRWIDRDT